MLVQMLKVGLITTQVSVMGKIGWVSEMGYTGLLMACEIFSHKVPASFRV